MAQIISFNPKAAPAPKAPKPEEEVHWQITIDPKNQNEVMAVVIQGRWWLSIDASSFDQLPALKEKVLKEWKIAKAKGRGVSNA